MRNALWQGVGLLFAAGFIVIIAVGGWLTLERWAESNFFGGVVCIALTFGALKLLSVLMELLPDQRKAGDD